MSCNRFAFMLAVGGVSFSLACRDSNEPGTATSPRADETSAVTAAMNPALVEQGKTIFRFDTFGDETFWTDTLRMHEVIRTR